MMVRPRSGPITIEKADWPVFRRRLRALLRPHRAEGIVFATVVLVSSVLRMAPPFVFRHIIDSSIPNGHRAETAWLASLGLAIAAGAAGLNLMGRWLGVRIGSGVALDLRRRTFAHLVRQPVIGFASTRPGAMSQRLTTDVVAVQSGVSTTLGQGLASAADVVMSVIAVAILSWPMALATLLLVPVYGLVSRRVGEHIRRAVGRVLELNERLVAWLTERLSFSGMATIRTFSAESQVEAEFDEQVRDARAASVHRSMVGRATFGVLSVLGAFGAALAYGVGGQLAIEGAVSIGTVVAVGVYLQRLLDPLSELSGFRGELESTVVALDRACRFVGDESVLLTDAPEAAGAIDGNGYVSGRGVASPGVALVVEDVTFTYEGGRNGESARPAVAELSLRVPLGGVVGVAGPSGSGKSTLGLVVAGLLDPRRGSVALQLPGQEPMTGQDLRRQAVYVAQDPFLLHASIAENLRFGRPSATEAELVAAARAAGIHDRILELPDGYDTVVGERGMTLSGGERQRVSLARALLRDPLILVLDEASAHLDVELEREIHEALATARGNRITIIIAHRLATLRSADEIVVMSEGRMAERGAHADLITTSGPYALLWQESVRA